MDLIGSRHSNGLLYHVKLYTLEGRRINLCRYKVGPIVPKPDKLHQCRFIKKFIKLTLNLLLFNTKKKKALLLMTLLKLH